MRLPHILVSTKYSSKSSKPTSNKSNKMLKKISCSILNLKTWKERCLLSLIYSLEGLVTQKYLSSRNEAGIWTQNNYFCKKAHLLGETSDFCRQRGEPIGVKVELGELTDLLDALRQHRDVWLGQVQAGPTLLAALGELAAKVLQGHKWIFTADHSFYTP